MFKIDISLLTKVMRKVCSFDSQTGGVRLDVKGSELTLYYADGHNTLVDKIPVTSDCDGNYIVNIVELRGVLSICQAGNGLEVDELTITPETSKKILKFHTVKRLKTDDKTTTTGMEINRSIPYRVEGDSAKDLLLISEDYTKLWSNDQYDIWETEELLARLRDITSAGSNIVIYSPQKQLFFAYGTRYIMLQSCTEKESRWGISLSVKKAKALAEILSQMQSDTVHVCNSLINQNTMTHRLIVVSPDSTESFSCETATLTKQDVLSMTFFCELPETQAVMTLNKRLLQDVVSAFVTTKSEVATVEAMSVNDMPVARFYDKSVKDSSDAKINSDITPDMLGKTFSVNVKSMQMMLPYIKGDVVLTLMDQQNKEQMSSYFKITGTGEGSAVYYYASFID